MARKGWPGIRSPEPPVLAGPRKSFSETRPRPRPRCLSGRPRWRSAPALRPAHAGDNGRQQRQLERRHACRRDPCRPRRARGARKRAQRSRHDHASEVPTARCMRTASSTPSDAEHLVEHRHEDAAAADAEQAGEHAGGKARPPAARRSERRVRQETRPRPANRPCFGACPTCGCRGLRHSCTGSGVAALIARAS